MFCKQLGIDCQGILTRHRFVDLPKRPANWKKNPWYWLLCKIAAGKPDNISQSRECCQISPRIQRLTPFLNHGKLAGAQRISFSLFLMKKYITRLLWNTWNELHSGHDILIIILECIVCDIIQQCRRTT